MNDQVQTQPVAVAQQVGQLASPWLVESAAVHTLRTWAWPTYVEEAERQNGLAYGTIPQIQDTSIRGASDLMEWVQAELPGIFVVCLKPEGEAELYASNGYAATYTLEVGVVVVGNATDEEWLARRDTSLIVSACVGAIQQKLMDDHPDVFANVTLLEPPSVEPTNPNTLLEWTGQCTFNVLVCPIVSRLPGFPEPLEPEEGPAAYTDAETTNLTFDAVEVDGDLS